MTATLQPTPHQDVTPHGGPIRRAIMRHPWWFGIAACLLFVPAIRPFLRYEPAPPPVYGALPAFELMDQDEAAFNLDRMAGKVWVAAFFFASCPTVCKTLTEQMGKLQDRLAADHVPVELVSFTVDPDSDTPARLKLYAQNHGAMADRWHFVTGTPEAIRSLVVDGFRTQMGDRAPYAEDASLYEISHTIKLVLIDGTGQLRGYYSSDEPGLDEVFHRAQHVLAENNG